jgi:hypothetical protein
MIEEPEKLFDNMFIVSIISLIIGFVLFESIIQDILVSIDPMFSYEYAAKMGNSGRAPDTPAGIALWTTCIVIASIYIWVIKPYLINWVTDEN